MEQGSLRCDVNISVRKKGENKLGTRTEMKNINSFKAAVRAIDFESNRHIEEIEYGGKLIQETRRWDDAKGESFSMRGKEKAQDYRYFPDPDLVYIAVSDEMIAQIKNSLPELPAARKERYIGEYNLTPYDAEQITNSKHLADFFEECISCGATPKTVCNWLIGDIAKTLNEKNAEPADIPSLPLSFQSLLSLLKRNNQQYGRQKVLSEMFEKARNPEEIVKELGLVQISDESALLRIITEVVSANPKSVEDYKAGKDKAIGYLIARQCVPQRGRAILKL